MYPILFKIGNFPIHTYGVMMILAFLAGLYIARKRAIRYGIDPNKLADMAFVTLVAGVLGARIVYLIQDPPPHWQNYFTLQFAGLTSFGGLIGGALAVLWWARRTKTPLLPILDVMGPPLLVGQAIGRVGCLLNGCCFGGVCPTGYPLGVHVEGNPLLHYPAQTYDTLMCLIAFGLVLMAEKRWKLRLGQVFALSLGFWGVSRIIDEHWRAGTDAQVLMGYFSSTYWGHLPFTQAQAAAFGLIVFSTILFFVFSRGKRPEPIAAAPASAAPITREVVPE